MPETLKIILAVMGIFILVFATTSFAGIFIKNTGVKQAEDSLEKIYSAIEQVERGEKEIVEVFLESPKGWFITAWPQTQHEDKPSQCETDYCICICKTGCEEEKETYCKKVFVEIKTKWIAGDSPVQINPLSPIKIYKETNKIVIEGREFTPDVQK